MVTQEHIGQVGLLPSVSSSAEGNIVCGVPPGNASTFIRNVFTQQIPTLPVEQLQLWWGEEGGCYMVGSYVPAITPKQLKAVTAQTASQRCKG